jgi:penicillin-binding protein 2
VISGGLIKNGEQGENIHLSIDSTIQSALFTGIKDLAVKSGFVGGAGVIMDVHTGEIFAMTSYPEYNPQVLADGSDVALIHSYMTSKARPFLNRATEGLYTPGSIIKPFLALAALHEGVITPYKQILSTKEMKVPNPFSPGTFSIFKDNAAHGLVDMRHAIAVSSNIYFYQIGGGFGSQKGIGIANIEKYSKMFGIGQKTGIELAGELGGTVPGVEWKAKHFPHDPWRIGDTYNTAIGQYGYQVTPLEMVRAMGGIATKGTLVTPTLIKKDNTKKVVTQILPFTADEYKVVQEGLLLDVSEGTARALLIDGLPVAAKTGTAQIKNNTRVNSWILGFFPYENPRFAFAVLMEDGPKVTVGAVHAFRPTLDFINTHRELLTQ